MKRICADCKIYLGEKEPLEDEEETHGLCFWCFLRSMRKIKEWQGEMNDDQSCNGQENRGEHG
ncbi:MAG: hypothetical protein HY739_13105 [Desulfobacterales bacterium]|nr:hypothetical protein [Desulfobacterales bacterium]